MYEDLRSSTVYCPTTMGELVNYKQKNPDAIFWAGGTYLMGKEFSYPAVEPIDIISLEKMDEMKRITRTDSSLEVGAMVSIKAFTRIAKSFFPTSVYNALTSISTQIVRSQATVGGAICTQNIKTSLTSILYCLDTMVEIRTIGKRSPARWIPFEKLFDKLGGLMLPSNVLLTKIHIQSCPNSIICFESTGSPMIKPEDTTQFTIRCKMAQNTITESRHCFNFPSIGLHNSEQLQINLTNIQLPMNPNRIIKLTEELISELKVAHPNLKPIDRKSVV